MCGVSDLRIERFIDPSYLRRVAAHEDVPTLGWAIRDDGAVFFDGAQVGRSGKYVFNRATGTPYGEITFEAIDGA